MYDSPNLAMLCLLFCVILNDFSSGQLDVKARLDAMLGRNAPEEEYAQGAFLTSSHFVSCSFLPSSAEWTFNDAGDVAPHLLQEE